MKFNKCYLKYQLVSCEKFRHYTLHFLYATACKTIRFISSLIIYSVFDKNISNDSYYAYFQYKYTNTIFFLFEIAMH